VETPAQLFAVLKKHLSINRGALLLADPEGQFFSPWSITGFDKTSEHRLRLPEPLLRELFSSVDETTTVLHKERLEIMEPYLSVREYATTTRLLLFPYYHQERLIAVLAVADSPYLEFAVAVLGVILSATADSVASLLYQNRELKLKDAAHHAVLNQSDLLAAVAELEEGNGRGEAPLRCISISIEDAVSRITRVTVDADQYRVRQDLTKIVASMFAGMGTVSWLDNGRLFIVVRGGEHADTALILHQIGTTICALFGELDAPPNLEAISKVLEPGMNPEDLVRTFF